MKSFFLIIPAVLVFSSSAAQAQQETVIDTVTSYDAPVYRRSLLPNKYPGHIHWTRRYIYSRTVISRRAQPQNKQEDDLAFERRTGKRRQSWMPGEPTLYPPTKAELKQARQREDKRKAQDAAAQSAWEQNPDSLPAQWDEYDKRRILDNLALERQYGYGRHRSWELGDPTTLALSPAETAILERRKRKTKPEVLRKWQASYAALLAASKAR
jgi:hypothetical protein